MKELLNKWFHRKVNIILGGLTVSVVIMDIRTAWGRTQFQVSPVAGKGDIWVNTFLEINTK